MEKPNPSFQTKVCTNGYFSDELAQNFTLTWGGATTTTGAYNRQTLLLNEV
jgi:hypothetical protein